MTKQARKSKVRDEASIVDGIIYFEDVFQCYLNDDRAVEILEDKHLKAIRVVSLSIQWEETYWVGYEHTKTDQINVEMTIRSEVRNKSKVWYAYRKRGGVLLKRYIGKSENINEIKLRDIARKFPN